MDRDDSAGVKTGPVVRVERNGPVTTICLSRPDVRNAVDRPTADALMDAFLVFDSDEDQRVAVFSGDHGTFCAGADLKAIAGGLGNRMADPGPFDPNDPHRHAGPMGPSRLMLSKPVIAAVSGYAVAGGMELALWCDMRVMDSQAVMGVFCRRWGVPLIDGGTVRLPRLIGQSRALDLILTGRPVRAEEALSMGLANRIAPPGQARAMAEDLASQLAQFPQTCMLNDRRSVYEQWSCDLEEAMVREFAYGRQTLASGESLSGAARFADGRGRSGRFDDL
ncbi:MAG: crotonase/enoyl-CoA hydratase family protein [Alphaproteobacteria bacterium]